MQEVPGQTLEPSHLLYSLLSGLRVVHFGEQMYLEKYVFRLYLNWPF